MFSGMKYRRRRGLLRYGTITILALALIVAFYIHNTPTQTDKFTKLPKPIELAKEDVNRGIENVVQELEKIGQDKQAAVPPPVAAGPPPHATPAVPPVAIPVAITPPLQQNVSVPAPHHVDNQTKPNAYVSIISNNKYVDGAMVLAWTLWKQSELLKAGKCKLLLLIPSGKLFPYNIQRLKDAGWHEIMEVKDLSEYAPRSSFLDTFNKLYMFGLTQFHKVVYYDADVLPMHNPDPLFETKVDEEKFVGAIGTPGDKYFKTGEMVFLPSQSRLEGMLGPLRKGKYNTPSGRDGALLRDYVDGKFIVTNPIYSQYRRPWQDLKGMVTFHYRGEFKPWYDERLVYKGQFKDPKRPPDFGPGYRLWWEQYAEMHYALDVQNFSMEVKLSGKRSNQVEDAKWGGSLAGPAISKSTHFWLQRMTKSEYIQKIWNPEDEAEVEIVKLPKVNIDGHDHTCDTACQRAHKECEVDRKKKNLGDGDFCNKACAQNFCHTKCDTSSDAQTHCSTVCKVGDKEAKFVPCNDLLPLEHPHAPKGKLKEKEKQNRKKAQHH